MGTLFVIQFQDGGKERKTAFFEKNLVGGLPWPQSAGQPGDVFLNNPTDPGIGLGGKLAFGI